MISRDEVFEALRDRGASGALVEVSGGNDEGDADRIVLLDGDAEIAEVSEHYKNFVRDENGRIVYEADPDSGYERAKRIPLTEAQQAEGDLAEALAEALAAPVYDEYGGFSGDFSVAGSVRWDVASRRVTMTGDES